LIGRGQLVIIALQGDYGKPRPALVVQSDLFRAFPSVVVCPLTSDIREDAEGYRVEIAPTPGNGLKEISQVSIDKVTAVNAAKIGKIIGEADNDVMERVTRALAIFLAIA
jgi:mRNA interferase MazF